MPGEPTAKQAGEARLVASSCEAVQAEAASEAVKAMRAAVDASFQSWHDGQPECWAEMREQHESDLRGFGIGHGRIGDALGAASGNMWGAGIGAGGIGTIGHGAGGGSGTVRAGAASVARTASGTNNQVAGVDEADMVKTDGAYVYLAANGALRIFEAMKPRVVSVTNIVGNVRELFVDGDRAVVYTSSDNRGRRCTYGYDCVFAGDGTSTKIVVLDIADRAAPKTVREIDLSGSLIAARRIGRAIHTVVADGDRPKPPYEIWPSDLPMCGTPEATVRAKFAQLKADNEKKLRALRTPLPTLAEHGVSRPLCDGVLRTAIADGEAFTSVVSFGLDDDKAPPKTASIQSRPGAVFASDKSLYVSVVHQKASSQRRWYSHYPSTDEISEVHKFRIGQEPSDTRYVGSGTVPGHVLNQFAMDEWYGYLRIATTKGRVPSPKVESLVSIFAEGPSGNLARVGAIEKIAPGEDIRSVRFDDDRAYVVTFKKTDPLFVMDLASPSRPAILGELKIPGFSTYMHRIDPDHLLSIGFDANDHGDFAYFDGVILQLFDVTSPTRPTLVHKEKIGTRGSSSQAATDHLAFNYMPDSGLLAIPMTICEGGGDGRNGDVLTFSGLLVYDVDVERGFERLGGVDHGTTPNGERPSCSTWWSHATSAVKRSVFLDDLVYSIAPDRVKVQRLDRLGVDLADLSLF
jgi:hypothetical protein